MAQNRQASSDTEAVELLKAAGVAENEINGVNNLAVSWGELNSTSTAFMRVRFGLPGQQHYWMKQSPPIQEWDGPAVNVETPGYAEAIVDHRFNFVPAEPQPITRRAIVRPE